MNIIVNKDLIFETDKYDVILLGTSTYCMLTNGFQSKMRLKYPFIEDANNKTNYGDKRKLGKRTTIENENTPIISLLYVCNYPNKTREFIDYEALENCLRTAAAEFKGKKIATTVIGSSLYDGNGDKEHILNIMQESLQGLDVDVYDYKQLDRVTEIKLQKDKIYKLKDIDFDKYQKLWDIKEEMFKKMYLK